MQTLHVRGDVVERLVGGGVVDDLGVGAVEEDDRVQDGEQERMDAQLLGDEREDRGAVGDFGTDPLAARLGVEGRSAMSASCDGGDDG